MTLIHQHFYGLLRMVVCGTPYEVSPMADEDWIALYRLAQQQSLTAVVYGAVAQLPASVQPPMKLSLQWMSDAESIRGMNGLLNEEAARLTQQFGNAGRRTAILKGQANARLYPDPMSRQPGDIDIWVEGGRKSVLALLPNHPAATYHHVHLPPNEHGVVVEVHFRPSSGNFNPFTNRRLQRWLEEEIKHTTMVEEGFYVPTVKFALAMQLSHVLRHFLASGIGLRQVCDYYWLLRNATDDDRQSVSTQLKAFGLQPMAGALMWVLGEVLLLDRGLMLCEPDEDRGRWLLREIMEGGNFGFHAKRMKTDSDITFFLRKVRHQMQILPFAPSEMIWYEIIYFKGLFKLLPERIRRGRLSLRDLPEQPAKS